MCVGIRSELPIDIRDKYTMYTETSPRDTEQLTLYNYCAKGLITESSYVPDLRCLKGNCGINLPYQRIKSFFF